jgi:hypothetical protein
VSQELSRLFITLGLTLLLIVSSVVGVHVIFILRELKKTIEKSNRILDDAGTVSGTVARSAGAVAGIVASIKEGSSIIKKLVNK